MQLCVYMYLNWPHRSSYTADLCGEGMLHVHSDRPDAPSGLCRESRTLQKEGNVKIYSSSDQLENTTKQAEKETSPTFGEEST